LAFREKKSAGLTSVEMAFPLGSVLNPGNLDEDYLLSYERPTRFILNRGDDGSASDNDYGELDGDPGASSPSDSLFVANTDSQARTPYNHLLSIHPQLRHQFSSSQSSVSVREDVSMTDTTDGLSQRDATSEATTGESEPDGVCYGMVSLTLNAMNNIKLIRVLYS
jgi:hypothetical protein